MRTIIVGFSHSTKEFSPFSTAIQWWDGTNYSHVYFQFESSKYDVDMIYQSSSTMLNYMSKEVFLMNNEVRKEFTLELTDDQYSSLMKKCMVSAGLPYAVIQIFGIVLADIFKLKFDKDLDLLKPSDIYKVLDENKT